MNLTKSIITLLWLLVAASAAAAPIDIGSRRELFVDRYLIDTMTDATLQLHHPTFADVAVRRDRPWEGVRTGTFDYVTVLKDGDRFRMYYRAIPLMGLSDGAAEECVCYAESTDGVHWVKPDLGLFEFQGSTKNNIVLSQMPPFCHNFSPLLDARPNVPADERYKALAGITPYSKGLAAFVSPDGIHWKRLREELVIVVPGPALDSQNVAFWSEHEECYVCYFRNLVDGVRAIARTTSVDFIHWTAPVQMRYGDGGTKPSEDLYTNQTQPYFRAPHIYIAAAARFMPGRRVLSDAQVLNLGLDKADCWLKDDCSDATLMSTRGGDHYERTFMDAWIRPGPDPRNWTSRSNYPAHGVIPTGADEMSIYVSRHNSQESSHIERLALRTDGFASLHAGYEGGEMQTHPLIFTGTSLEVNFATSAAGGIRVEVQDEMGKCIPGFAAEDCRELVGDQIERTVLWNGGDVSTQAGRPIRLRVILKDADLYAIRFR